MAIVGQKFPTSDALCARATIDACWAADGLCRGENSFLAHCRLNTVKRGR
jgi:hypothetical protein